MRIRSIKEDEFADIFANCDPRCGMCGKRYLVDCKCPKDLVNPKWVPYGVVHVIREEKA